MLIVRDFQDYYDSAIGFGVDKKIVYKRSSVEFRESKHTPKILDDVNDVIRQLDDQRTRFSIHPYSVFYVGFCGKIWTGLYARIDAKTGLPVTTFSYSDAHVLPKAFYWGEKDFLAGEFDKARKASWQRGPADGGHTLRDWFSQNKSIAGHDALDVFTEHKIVSFVHFENTLITNPCLKNFSFQRVIGGVEAFQEIAMFISGVLGQPENDTSPLEDKYRIMAHGFDKHSFRKGPLKR